MAFQQKDESIIQFAKEKSKEYSIKQYHRAGMTYSLICRHEKVVIPILLQKSFIE